MKKLIASILLVFGMIGFSVPSSAAPMEVTFSEVVLPSLTPLDGTNFYDPFGISFADRTQYALDGRFVEDGRGITNTSGGNTLVTVIFDQVTSFVDFTWLTISSERLTARAYNAAGVIVDTFGILTPGGNTSNTATLFGSIKKVTWSDGEGRFGIDSIRYEVPIVSSLALMLFGLVGLGAVRRTRG